jgi:hypothetical protein
MTRFCIHHANCPPLAADYYPCRLRNSRLCSSGSWPAADAGTGQSHRRRRVAAPLHAVGLKRRDSVPKMSTLCL